MLIWFYSFTENMQVLGTILLVISGLLTTIIIIGLQGTRKIDKDDAEAFLFITVPTLILSLSVILFPSLDQIAKNQLKWNEVVKTIEPKVTKFETLKGDELNEEIPNMLKHSCSERVCR